MSARKMQGRKNTANRPAVSRPMSPTTRRRALTPAERQFCAYVAIGFSLREAARQSGLNERNVGHYIKRPLVEQHIEWLKRELAQEDARSVAEAAHITREQIIGRLALLSRVDHRTTKGVSGQVAACMGLAKIMGMLIERNLNLGEFFRGWTEEEIEQYAITGEVPERLKGGSSLGA